jgi:hypothetical protein
LTYLFYFPGEVELGERWMLTVDARTAEQKIKITRRQRHSVSRVFQEATGLGGPSPAEPVLAASAVPPALGGAQPMLAIH